MHIYISLYIHVCIYIYISHVVCVCVYIMFERREATNADTNTDTTATTTNNNNDNNNDDNNNDTVVIVITYMIYSSTLCTLFVCLFGELHADIDPPSEQR